jgi:hypothetical protein
MLQYWRPDRVNGVLYPMSLILRNIISLPCPVDGNFDRAHRLLHPLDLSPGRTISVLSVFVMKFGIFLPIGVVAYSNLEPFWCRSVRILRLLKFNPGLLRSEFFSHSTLSVSPESYISRITNGQLFLRGRGQLPTLGAVWRWVKWYKCGPFWGIYNSRSHFAHICCSNSATFANGSACNSKRCNLIFFHM